MIVIVGTLLMLVVIILSILLLFGLPLGELTMGGQYRVFPKKTENAVSNTACTTDIFCCYYFADGRVYTTMVFI